MAISLSSISKGKAKLAPRILLLGVEKIGKSTWASQAPSPIFIPIIREQGLDQIDCAKFPPAGSYAAVKESLASLCNEEHDYKTVVIDSASTLEPLIWDQTCADNGAAASIEKVNGGYGKGYIEALQYWRELQTALDYLRESKGMGVILVGHVKVKTFNDPLADPYDQYQFDLQDKAANLFYRWADAILFANFKVFSKQVAAGGGDKKTTHATDIPGRYLFTEKRPGHPGGNRYGLPYELQFEYAAFADAMSKAA